MLLLSPATEKQSKLSKKREGRSGKGREDQEGTGPAELSSFSGPATKSRTRESVWTSQLTEPFKPILEPRPGLPALRGDTLSSLVPRVRREELRVFKHSRGGDHQQCQSPETSTTRKQTDKLGEPGVLPVSRDRSGGRQLPGVKRWPHPSSVGLRSPKKLQTALDLCGGGVSAK